MKIKTKLLLTAAALLLVLAASWLLLQPVLNKQPQVTLVMKTSVTTAEFWEFVVEGVQEAAADYNVDLTITGSKAEKEIQEQIDVMDRVIENEPDVIILAATDFNAMVDSAEQVVDAGIDLVTMDSDVNTDARTCYIASDNYAIGCAMGALMVEQCPQGGKIALLAHGSSSSAIDRIQGAVDKLKKAGNFEIVGTFDCNDDPSLAQEYTAQVLEQYDDLAAILCSNEGSNIGAADYIARNAADRDLTLIGCDSSKTQVRYLEQGIIQGIVIQQPFNMGYMAVKSAAQLAKGESLPEQVVIPCVTITKENMNDIENQKLLFPFMGEK